MVTMLKERLRGMPCSKIQRREETKMSLEPESKHNNDPLNFGRDQLLSITCCEDTQTFLLKALLISSIYWHRFDTLVEGGGERNFRPRNGDAAVGLRSRITGRAKGWLSRQVWCGTGMTLVWWMRMDRIKQRFRDPFLDILLLVSRFWFCFFCSVSFVQK